MSGADADLLLKRFKNFINQRPVVILQARQRFPDNAAVKLVWGNGIKTTTLVSRPHEDQEFSYKTRKPLQGEIRL